MKIVFKVKVKYEPSMQMFVVGDLPELGAWNVEKALYLQFKGEDWWEADAKLDAPENRKFEFKLVKKYYNGTVVWEELPDNSNRKFRIGEDVELTMEWSNHKGRRKLLKKTSVKLAGLPSIVISGPVMKDTSSNKKYFNPFHDAENSGSEEEPPQPSAKELESGYDAKSFESIFYRLPKEKIYLSRMNSKLHTIYVISRKHPQQCKFSAEIRDYLKNLRCSACWIVEGPLEGKPIDGNIRYFAVYEKQDSPRTTLLQDYEDKLMGNIPPNAICLIIDVSLATIKLQFTINGLLLGRLTPEQTEQLKKADLQNIRCVAFVHMKDMKHFVEAVGAKSANSEEHRQLQNHIDDKINQNIKDDGNDALEILLYEMQQEVEVVSPSRLRMPPHANVGDLDKVISEKNSALFIIDLNLISKSQDPKQIIDRLKQVAKLKGRFVIVVATRSREEIETDFPELVQQSKLVIIANDGVQVRLHNTWINVLERHQRNIAVIRNKFREYMQCYGGSESHTLESMSYVNEDLPILQKVRREVSDMLNDEKYLKVSSTDTAVKVSWRLKESRATLQTVVQLRCMVDGSLQLICVLIGDHKKECIYDDMDNLAKAFPSYFKENFVRQYLMNAHRPSEHANGYLTQEQIDNFMFGLL